MPNTFTTATLIMDLGREQIWNQLCTIDTAVAEFLLTDMANLPQRSVILNAEWASASGGTTNVIPTVPTAGNKVVFISAASSAATNIAATAAAVNLRLRLAPSGVNA